MTDAERIAATKEAITSANLAARKYPGQEKQLLLALLRHLTEVWFPSPGPPERN